MNYRNILITGSSKGIGAAIAATLAKVEYNIFLTGRNEENLKQIQKEINAKDYFVVDLKEDNACEKLVGEIASKYGDIDILINNAGDYIYNPVEDTTDAQIQSLMRLNVEVPYKLIKLVVPSMKNNKWGRIINIGSISGSVGEANASLYSMTKSAMSGLTKSLALELAQDGITVNTINPGWVETELAVRACEESDFPLCENIEMIPQRRFIDPSEVGALVKYLVSEEAKGLTGQCINLCAGLSVG